MTRDSAVGTPPLDVLDLAWRIGAGAVTTVLFCALLGLTFMAAALFPQQPAGLDAGAAERWLVATAANYGSLGPVLRNVSAFHILASPGLTVIFTLLAYHLLLATASAVGRARQMRRSPAGLPPLGLVPHATQLQTTLVAAAGRVAEALPGHGYGRPTAVLDSPTRAVFFAERRRWAGVGPVLVYAGGLLILLGLLANGATGWTMPEVTMAPDSSATLPGSAGLQARLEALDGPDSAPLATVLLTRQDGQAARARTGYARPALWGNLWLSQRAIGPALAVDAQDTRGRPVILQSQPAGGHVGPAIHVLFTATQTEQVFAAPDRNLAFRVVNYPALPGRGSPQAAFLVEVYRGADPTPILSQLVRGLATVGVDDVVYTFKPERHAVLAISYWPGLWLLALGGPALLIGSAISLWWGQRRAWVSLIAERDGEVLSLVRVLAWLGAGPEAEALTAELSAGKQAAP